MSRVLYLVGPYNGQWLARCGEHVIGMYPKRVKAMNAAAKVARSRWKVHGERGELRVQRCDGTIGETRTYGRDPRRTPG